MNDMELYQEENLKVLKEVSEYLKGAQVISMAPRMPEKMKAEIINRVTAELVGEIKVDKSSIAFISDEINKQLEIIASSIANAIRESQPEVLAEIKVNNLSEAKTEEVTVKNLRGIEDKISDLTKAVIDNKPYINVEKQDITFPRAAKDYISVRLTDGQSYYDAKGGGVISGFGGSSDPLIGYQVADKDDSSDPKYFGFANSKGAWYILKEENSSYRYAAGTPRREGGGLYTDAWTNRANLDYFYFYEVF